MCLGKTDWISCCIALGCLGCLLLPGCSGSNKIDKPKQVYKVAQYQAPLDPVYSTEKVSRPAYVLPSKELPATRAPLLLPVFHLELKNAKLAEVAEALAKTARYKSFCVSSINDRRISINSIGTIDELGDTVGQMAGINVVVDHDIGEVRFLAHEVTQPELLDNS